MRPRVIAGAFATALTIPRVAVAGGFEVPDRGARAVGRGGAYALGARDLTAMHYNPAALARLRGTRLMLHNDTLFHHMSYSRAALSEDWGEPLAGTQFEPVREGSPVFPLLPFIALSSDFGLEDWTFAAGVYGPHAYGRHDYPRYGPQSFALTHMDIIILYYSLAAAWKWQDVFGVGVTVQWVDGIRMRYGTVVDAQVTEDLSPIPRRSTADDPSTQLHIDMQMQDRTGFAALVGVWGRPIPQIELGVGGRVTPVPLRMRGSVETDATTISTEGLRAALDITLPVHVQGGIRYRHLEGGRERFDVEVDLFWENWSTIDAYDLRMDGKIAGLEVADIRLDKAWRDTFSVRAGGDLNLLEDHLSLRLGGLWERGAAPLTHSHLDFPSFMRGGLGAGISGEYRGVALTVGYMHVFQEDRQLGELAAKQFQPRPLAPCPDDCAGQSGVPANAGRYRSSFDILSVGLDVRFDALRGRGGGRAEAQPPRGS